MRKEELLEQIKNAMRAQDKTRLSILRQVNQAIKQVEVDERREATEADLAAAVKKLQKIISEELDALSKLDAASHAERVAELTSQAEALISLLPPQLSGSELEALADTVIAELGAETKRDMGKVMGELTTRTDGNFDKPSAAAYVGSKLA